MCETENFKSLKLRSKCWSNVVLPDPEGAETMYRFPRIRRSKNFKCNIGDMEKWGLSLIYPFSRGVRAYAVATVAQVAFQDLENTHRSRRDDPLASDFVCSHQHSWSSRPLAIPTSPRLRCSASFGLQVTGQNTNRNVRQHWTIDTVRLGAPSGHELGLVRRIAKHSKNATDQAHTRRTDFPRYGQSGHT